jgi:hypothetical protein
MVILKLDFEKDFDKLEHYAIFLCHVTPIDVSNLY